MRSRPGFRSNFCRPLFCAVNGTLATLRGQTVSSANFFRRAEAGSVEGSASVLIDATTSGAAEVLASAIVANHRGDVVGERTFGLASEQKLITLDDGSALILTTANYYNPSGKSILEEGVAPTEVVLPQPRTKMTVTTTQRKRRAEERTPRTAPSFARRSDLSQGAGTSEDAGQESRLSFGAAKRLHSLPVPHASKNKRHYFPHAVIGVAVRMPALQTIAGRRDSPHHPRICL